LSADDGSAHYEYVCIMRDGNLLRGEHLQGHTRRTPYQCQVSAGATWPWATEAAAIERLSLQFQSLLAGGCTPIASQESWLLESDIFKANETLPRLGLRAKVVVFVRPQIPWMNSLWWQSGAWSSTELREFIESNKCSARWTSLTDAWRSVPGVDEVEIHLVGDVVSTFFRSIGIALESPKRRNVSLDENLLSYLRARPDLRPVHNPVVDFVLEQRLAATAKGTPWVLQRNQISDLMDYYRTDNLDLLSLVSSEARRAMEQDPMWWDAAAYSERQAVAAERSEPGIEVLKDVAGRAIDSVVSLDGRVRQLEESQRQLILALEAQRQLTRAAEAALCEPATATEAAKPKPMAARLRKAISINGIRRMISA
jgi:hypothetical protein